MSDYISPEYPKNCIHDSVELTQYIAVSPMYDFILISGFAYYRRVRLICMLHEIPKMDSWQPHVLSKRLRHNTKKIFRWLKDDY